MSPQNMPLWGTDNFELKTLEKQQVQESSPPSPLCLKAGHEFPEKVTLPAPGREGHCYRQTLAVGVEMELYKKTY